MRRFFLILLTLGILAGGVVFFLNKNKKESAGGTGGVFKDFFPLTRPSGTSGEDVNDKGGAGGSETEAGVTASAFKQLTKRPVAGYTLTSKTKQVLVGGKTQTTTEDTLRYVSRQSGFVYEMSRNGTSPVQISNIFIPNIYEAVFLDKGTTAILRFLADGKKVIETYSVPIPPENKEGTRTQLQGVFFPSAIGSVTPSPDTKTVAQLSFENTNSALTISTPVNKDRKEVFFSPLKEWVVSWPEQKSIYLQTKPSGYVEGFLYKLDTKEKKLKRVLGNILGLTTSVSPSGTYILYSESKDRSFTTKVFNTRTGEEKSIGLSILPEKCVWLQNEDLICGGNNIVEPNTYPDAWYAGITELSDKFYRIYTKNAVFDVLYENSGPSFDTISLQVDEGTSTLYFIDKKSGLLWGFEY